MSSSPSSNPQLRPVGSKSPLFQILLCFSAGLAAFRATEEEVLRRIVGLGSCGVDFLAQVEEYPSPDDKIRTTDFKVFGGGNAANTLSALGKLGNSAQIVTIIYGQKIGKDANGEMIMKELESAGVGVDFVLQSDRTPSPFTYVIVDKKSSTRTCIHTPATEELSPDGEMLDNCSWVHLDGRHTPAATKLGELANSKGVLVSLDVEKDRPGLAKLLTKANMLFTNSKYPHIFAEKHGDDSKDIEANMKTILLQLPRLQFVVSTMGADGSIAVVRENNGEEEEEEGKGKDNRFLTFRCQAWQIDAKDIVDTTGAGDAYIAGVIHALVRKQSLESGMKLGRV
eukprot:jgi/Bigna1/128856/aug1.7_g3564